MKMFVGVFMAVLLISGFSFHLALAQPGNVTTVAGSGNGGFQDGPGSSAQFKFPIGITVDGIGNLFVCDQHNNRIRKIDANGIVSTFAGNGSFNFQNGQGTNSAFRSPIGIDADANGNLYIADKDNAQIRKIDPNGNVTTYAGGAGSGYQDGPAAIARFSHPNRVGVAPNGDVYVADASNYRIRKIDLSGNVTTVMGNGSFGFQDGPALSAQLRNAGDFAFDGAGNVYFTDSGNHRIRKIDNNGIVTTVAGTGNAGFQDGGATTASFNYPSGLVMDNVGNLIVGGEGSHRIRIIDVNGNVTTLSGTSQGYGDGVAALAQFNGPLAIELDGNGDIVVADFANHRIRKVEGLGLVTQVPTLSEWGLILLMLTILCIGAISLKQRGVKVST